MKEVYEGSEVGFFMRRGLVLASIMLAMFLAAIEATIVSTAMPGIVADLGGFSLYSWVFSAYLLTNASTVLLFGKLSDTYGRKPIFMLGICLFLLGSIIAALANGMVVLIAARFVQGLGAGALMPIATTIVGDIYSKEERAKIQGYLSSVWGISAVTGPLLGGFFVDVLSWPFVFWMNLPLGMLALTGVMLFFKEDVEKQEARISYKSSIYVMLMVSLVVLMLVEGGIGIAWLSLEMLILFLTALGSFILFRQAEKKTSTPMLPLHLWENRSIRYANLTSLTTGMILIGVSSYLPAFVQGVMEQSATVAGFTLTTMSIGWPIAATLAGRLLLKAGFRFTSIVGGCSLIIGAVLFSLLSPEKGPVFAAVGSLFIGIGMGFSTTSFIVSIQNSVDWKMRGIATASNMFMRTLGSALGAAVLGGLLNNRIHQSLEQEGLDQEYSVDSTNLLLNEEARSELSAQALTVFREGLTNGLHQVYVGLLILAVISFLLILRLPKNG
ncbi:MDR family MFS transporter [Halobacillus sp. B23F22_1]|uniref:MDR family MFS transporter n=1 Tax=Halobacillus sp. B23F22_1 TaxID=3459514 RepID=UPI00373F47AA